MKRAFCTVLFLLPALVFGETLVFRNGDDVIRMMDAPCTAEAVLSRVARAEHASEDFRAASAVIGGQNFTACWRNLGGVVHLIYEDGDQGLIRKQQLKPETSV